MDERPKTESIVQGLVALGDREITLPVILRLKLPLTVVDAAVFKPALLTTLVMNSALPVLLLGVYQRLPLLVVCGGLVFVLSLMYSVYICLGLLSPLNPKRGLEFSFCVGGMLLSLGTALTLSIEFCINSGTVAQIPYLLTLQAIVILAFLFLGGLCAAPFGLTYDIIQRRRGKVQTLGCGQQHVEPKLTTQRDVSE